MADYTELTVDLARPPGDRWQLSDEQRAQAVSLLGMYSKDLGLDGETAALLQGVAGSAVAPSLRAELDALASAFAAEPGQLILANLYYDLLKFGLGCTAFAVNHPRGPLHARNLDWWTENRALNDCTMVTRFVNGPVGEFITLGWPGFVGAFSGMAVGRFAVSLNAVLSEAPGQVATSSVMLIRDVLEHCPDFESAVRRLGEERIATDCLLLVTGTREGDAVVLERTPTDVAERWLGHATAVAVTNEYVALDADSAEPTSELQRTSCQRFDRITDLANEAPATLERCLDLLSDDQVMMEITVQQMAFQASTGEYAVRIP